MKKIIIVVIAVTLLLMMATPFQGGFSKENIAQANSSPIWPMFHYNTQHTGRCPYDTSKNNGTLKWKYKTGDSINSSPAIASDGIIYVGSYDNYLYAIGNQSTTTPPSSPQNLQANASTSSVTLNWSPSTQGTYPIAGYAIYRGPDSGKESDTPIATVDANTTTYTDKNIKSNKTYYYMVKAYDNQNPPNYSASSNEVKIGAQTIVITLQPDNPMMTVNGAQKEIDQGRGTKPVIIKEWGRTVVPIRAIVEALRGTIGWDGTERKVTINFKGTTIELWIDGPQAEVNGVMKWIDPKNHNVKPIIVNDRTMLPLRFVAESLGCTVDWDSDTRTITITYNG